MTTTPVDATALGRILALHQPDTAPVGDGEAVVCKVCVDRYDLHVNWPCATVTALMAAMQGGGA